MGNTIGILILAVYVLWSGIAVLRNAKRSGPTSLDSLMPLRGRWLRIAHGVLLLLLSLFLGSLGVFGILWAQILQRWP